ncbi:hypothetical protein ACKC9G_08010 [Pokkaliibacter sp. CJK22405]|uniref:hypothetical protein n=1 Tax=Pokkaliibacter sp. CJK22405 TaxID=3384615 RepID=UPI0039849A98
MRYLLIGIAFLLCAVGWLVTHNGPTSYVEVEFMAPEGAAPLAAVTLISGGDKTWVTDIAPGETKSVRIYPGEFADNAVVAWVQRYPDGNAPKEGWSGKQLYPAETAFLTHLVINNAGQVVDEKSCKLPCSFD